MAKFIEAHVKGDPCLINLDLVEEIIPAGGGCEVYFGFATGQISQDYIKTDESYEHLRLMIGAAQGGIPMDTGGSY